MNDTVTPAPVEAAAPASVPDAASGAVGAPPYYCPGCGARYFAPGVCTNQHPAIELEQDAAVPLPTEPASPLPAPAEAVTPPDALGAPAPVEPGAAIAEPAPAEPLDLHNEIASIVNELADAVEAATHFAHARLDTLMRAIGA